MKRSRILSVILVLGLVLTGCSTTKAQRVTIELESNPTTGYEWDEEQKEVSGEEIFEIEDEMIPSKSDELGAPGVQKFVLSPEHAGSTVVDFYYGREWEENEYLYAVSYEFEVSEDMQVTFVKKTVTPGTDMDESDMPEFPDPVIE